MRAYAKNKTLAYNICYVFSLIDICLSLDNCVSSHNTLTILMNLFIDGEMPLKTFQV